MHRSVNGRLTWQVDGKNKVSFAGGSRSMRLLLGHHHTSGTTASVSLSDHIAWITSVPTMQIKWTNVHQQQAPLEAGGSRNTMNWNGAPQPGVEPDSSPSRSSAQLHVSGPTLFNGGCHHEATVRHVLRNLRCVVRHRLACRPSRRPLLHGRPYTNFQVNGDRTYQSSTECRPAVILRNHPALATNRLKGRCRGSTPRTNGQSSA